MDKSKAAPDADLEGRAGAELGAADVKGKKAVVALLADLEDADLAENKLMYKESEAIYEPHQYYESCKVNSSPPLDRATRCLEFVLFGGYLERMLSDSVCSCL
jgi:hypothetical protein